MSKPARMLAFVWLMARSAILLAQPVSIPARGTPFRKELMDAMRQQLERELKQAILFEVKTLHTRGEWTFGELTPKRKDGKPIDYTRTPYAGAVEAGIFDEGVSVLWYRQQGVWRVKTYVVGATDVPYGCWWKVFKAPKVIFTYVDKYCTD